MKKIIITLLSFLPLSIFAATGSAFPLSVEPIYGFETVQKLEPTVHTKNRAVYGLRAVVGSGIIRAEAEVTQSKDSESFPDRNLTIDETTNKAKLGLRLNFRMASLLNWYVRGGMQVKQSEVTKTENSVVTKKKSGYYPDPYAGTGLRINLLRNFSLTADYAIIWSDYPVSNKKEYQSTLGFAVRI